jgi:hypothetical protein
LGAEFRQRRPEVSETTLAAIGANRFSRDFVFSVLRHFVRSCLTPLLILAGNDPFHTHRGVQGDRDARGQRRDNHGMEDS